MQFAAATAAKGTNLLTIGGRRCNKESQALMLHLNYVLHSVNMIYYLGQRLQSQGGDYSSRSSTDIGCPQLTMSKHKKQIFHTSKPFIYFILCNRNLNMTAQDEATNTNVEIKLSSNKAKGSRKRAKN